MSLFSKKPLIVTHPARFHADDLFAVAMLLEYFEGKAKVSRTDDKNLIAKADFVLDIGRIYDSAKNRFDHHQGGVGARENGVSYASAGLVWKHYGEKIAGSKKAQEIIDDKLVASIDALDTGEANLKPLVAEVYPYFLNNITSSFGNTWLEQGRDYTESFMYLLPFAREILKREIKHAEAKVEAEKIINDVYDKTEDKRIIILDKLHLPISLLTDKPEPLFAIVPELRSNGWAVHTVRKEKHTFENRKDLPREWGGRDNEELAKVTGVPDAVFCHLKLFLAVAKSKEGAIALAKKALEN